MSGLNNITDTVTSATGNPTGLTSNVTSATGNPTGIASNTTKSNSLTDTALPAGRLDVIKGVLGLNTNHKGELIGLSKDDNDALINILAKEKLKKDKNMSDNDLNKLSKDQILEMSNINKASDKEIQELAEKDSVKKFKQDAQNKTQRGGPTNGVFYAYGVQKAGGLTKRFLYTFANASVANQYIEKLQGTYGAAVKRHGAQFFTLPETPNPFTIAENQEFKHFDQMYIVEEAQAPQPIIPSMDEAGYSNARGHGCGCTCGKASNGKGSTGNTSDNSNVKPSNNTGGNSGGNSGSNSGTNTNTTDNQGSNNTTSGGNSNTSETNKNQSSGGNCHHHCCGCHGSGCDTSDAELIRVASKIADEKKKNGDTRSYADIFAEAFKELKSSTKSK